MEQKKSARIISLLLVLLMALSLFPIGAAMAVEEEEERGEITVWIVRPGDPDPDFCYYYQVVIYNNEGRVELVSEVKKPHVWNSNRTKCTSNAATCYYH